MNLEEVFMKEYTYTGRLCLSKFGDVCEGRD